MSPTLSRLPAIIPMKSCARSGLLLFELSSTVFGRRNIAELLQISADYFHELIRRLDAG